MWKISKLLQKASYRILLSTSLESSPRHSNNHLYLTNLLGYSLEGFFNTDNCQNYWQNLLSWSLVRRGITGRESDNKYEDEGWSAAQTLGSSSPVLWAIKYIAGAGSGSSHVMCRAKYLWRTAGAAGLWNMKQKSKNWQILTQIWCVRSGEEEGELTERYGQRA